MIELIVGPKGTGKTKALIEKIRAAVKVTNGNVVCIEKGLALRYDIDYTVRLVDIESYDVKDFNSLYGFIAGIMAGNYDISDIFVDATLKIGGNDLAAFGSMIEKLSALLKEHEVKITFTVSCEKSDIPDNIKKYVI